MGIFRRKDKKLTFYDGKKFYSQSNFEIFDFFQKKKNRFSKFLFFAIAQGVET